VKILLYADFRSEFAKDYLVSLKSFGHDVHSVQSRATNESKLSRLQKSIKNVRLKFSRSDTDTIPQSSVSNISGYTISDHLKVVIRVVKAVFFERFSLQAEVSNFQPDVVHAMRVPFEGITAGLLRDDTPLVVSIWGNDFTYHAASSPIIRKLTTRLMARISCLHVDAEVDRHRAHTHGMPTITPCFTYPSSGGVRLIDLPLNIGKSEMKERLGLKPDTILVVNPRGKRDYVNNQLFCDCAEELKSTDANIVYLAVGIQRPNIDWQPSNGISLTEGNLFVTPDLDRARFYNILRAADIVVSPTYHDGTPNSILEAMACGAIPILSKLESTAYLCNEETVVNQFDMNDTGNLILVLQSCIDAKNFEFAANLNERYIQDNHSTEACSNLVQNIYESAIRQF